MIISPHKTGVLLRIRVKTGAKEESILGIQGDAIKVAVKEKPEKGKANKAVIDLIANHINCNSSCIQIKTGTTSQNKILFIENTPLDYIKMCFNIGE